MEVCVIVEKALNGICLCEAVVVVVLTLVAVLVVPVPVAEVASEGGVKTPDAGVNNKEVVVAFEPADEDADDEKDCVAPAPVVPAEAFAWR